MKGKLRKYVFIETCHCENKKKLKGKKEQAREREKSKKKKGGPFSNNIY